MYKYLQLTLALIISYSTSSAQAVEQGLINHAMERGVEALKKLQKSDGTWPYKETRGTVGATPGATAMAGLTLLELGESADSKAVQNAADAVRKASPTMTYTYSISLAIMFFDRLGDPSDIPLLESLTVRLLAGQRASGMWSYQCPPIPASEIRRLQTHLNQRNELRGTRKLPRPTGKRTVKDLPKEIQQQLMLINRHHPGRIYTNGDNSNTQFATLALWIARRHGFPVQKALALVNQHFRRSQYRSGGWSYIYTPPQFRTYTTEQGPGTDDGSGGPTAAMTAAGLLGLAANYGSVNEIAQAQGKKGANPKVDRQLAAGIRALSTAIERPKGNGDPHAGGQGVIRVIPRQNGTAFYMLWSIERVAMILDLKTIGQKDWYAWGAEILLANQQRDGLWVGNYGDSGVDTCFALLFLKRSNLAGDLTAQLKGKVSDIKVLLKGGGVGGAGLKGENKIRSGLDKGNKIESGLGKKKEMAKLPSIPNEVEQNDVSRLSSAFLGASGSEREQLLKQLRDKKGGVYTSALSLAIPLLDGQEKREARRALEDRLGRMTEATLKKYLEFDNAEIRRAASLAVANRDLKKLTADVINLLADPETDVVRAASASLQAMTGKDFGPKSGASDAEREQAIKDWRAWWSTQ